MIRINYDWLYLSTIGGAFAVLVVVYVIDDKVYGPFLTPTTFCPNMCEKNEICEAAVGAMKMNPIH